MVRFYYLRQCAYLISFNICFYCYYSWRRNISCSRASVVML